MVQDKIFGTNGLVNNYHSLRERYVSELNCVESVLGKKMRLKVIETIDSPIYAAILSNAGRSLEIVDKAHELIMCEALKVLYYDLFQETNSVDYQSLSKKYAGYVRCSLDAINFRKLSAMESELSRFWDIERKLSEKLERNEDIWSSDIDGFTLKKSSDVFAYFFLLNVDSFVPGNIKQVLYARQLERDMNDDLSDLLEDHDAKMPNPFLLRLASKGFYDVNGKYSQDDLKSLVDSTDARKIQQNIVDIEVLKSDSVLKRYPSYSWIKFCSA